MICLLLIILPIITLLLLGLTILTSNPQTKYHIRSGVADNPAYINHRIYTVNPVIKEVSFSTAITKKLFHIIPRAAFFDKRVRGKHNSATVVLAHLNKTEELLNLIVACTVNGHSTKTFEIKSLKINSWLHKEHPECTHDDILIFCYYTPAKNNSKVSIVYINPENESEYIAVESEHPLLVPKQRKSHSTVMVCTTVFDTPPHIGAWIRYQKMLGVDMVYINAQESFLYTSSFKDAFFLESLRNGFIQLKVWKEHLPGATHYHSQALYYQNCLYRYLGVYDYCICADTDDFLVSIDDRDFGVHKMIQKLFNPKPLINTASLHWIRYLEPAGGFDPSEVQIKDGNLTRYVNTSISEDEGNGRTKSIYKLSAMIELGVHESIEFLSTKNRWKQFGKIPRTKAYMAHIKKTHRV